MTTGRIGTSRGCKEFRVHAALGVPPLRGLGLDAAPDRMNAELRTRVTPCAPPDFTPPETVPGSASVSRRLLPARACGP